MIVQVYEIQTPAEVEKLSDLGVDHFGSVILAPHDWNNPEIKATVRCVRDSGAKSCLIPLYNDADAVMRTIDYHQPDIIHFCDALPFGAQKAGACRGLTALQAMVRKRFPGTGIMRSVPIRRSGRADLSETLALARLFEPVSDYFLTDTLLGGHAADKGSAEPVPGFVGITGKTCDWEVAGKLVDSVDIPVILAGGINPENVAEGIRRVAPAGIDSCTGTNASGADGKPIRFQKDREKVRRLVEAARRAAAEQTLKNE